MLRNNSQIANIGYNKDMEQVKKKRGRPKGFSPKKADVQEQVVEAIREVFIEKIKIIEGPAPELKGFELYLALKNQGFRVVIALHISFILKVVIFSIGSWRVTVHSP